jgi:hypothetical protein
VAYDAQYNHWRRLVTHHDPEMANRANQALRWLEQIRVTLLDPEKRAAYDAEVGLDKNVSGLADPRAMVPTVVPPAPVAQAVKTAPLPSIAQSANVWICPKCQTRHTAGALFCKKCGYRLGMACPQCNTVVSSDSRFCPTCGVNIPEAIQQKEFEKAERQRKQREAERRLTQQQAAEEAQKKALKHATIRMTVIGGVLGIIAGPIAWAIIWPDMMEAGICVVGQAIMGAIGGAGVNWWASEKLVDPLKTEASTIISVIGGILGGIFAFPAIVIGVIIAII